MFLQLNGQTVASAGVTILVLYIVRKKLFSSRKNIISPFATDSRLPRTDLITDKEQRAGVLKQGKIGPLNIQS